MVALGHDAPCLLGFRELMRHDVLKAGARIDGALKMTDLDELVDANLLAADTGTDILDLAAPTGIGERDHAAFVAARRLLGEARIAELANGNDGHQNIDTIMY